MTKSTSQRRWHIENVRPRHPDLTPIGQWSSANRNCYADFRTWLKAAGYGDSTLQQYCVGARLVFGLVDKPYWVLDPETDLPYEQTRFAKDSSAVCGGSAWITD